MIPVIAGRGAFRDGRAVVGEGRPRPAAELVAGKDLERLHRAARHSGELRVSAEEHRLPLRDRDGLERDRDVPDGGHARGAPRERGRGDRCARRGEHVNDPLRTRGAGDAHTGGPRRPDRTGRSGASVRSGRPLRPGGSYRPRRSRRARRPNRSGGPVGSGRPLRARRADEPLRSRRADEPLRSRRAGDPLRSRGTGPLLAPLSPRLPLLPLAPPRRRRALALSAAPATPLSPGGALRAGRSCAGPCGPVGPTDPASPVSGPTQFPIASMTCFPFTVTVVGLMSPRASRLTRRERDARHHFARRHLTASVPILIPRYYRRIGEEVRREGVTGTRAGAEKYPPS